MKLNEGIHIGFTGTQRGMTKPQTAVVRRFLEMVFEEASGMDRCFHHGDCIGADAQAHQLAIGLGYSIELHPPDDSSKRAFCRDCGRERAALPYLIRNRAIVDVSNMVIAAPAEEHGEVLRSGTWSTVRYARRQKKMLIVVRPSGASEGEARWL